MRNKTRQNSPMAEVRRLRAEVARLKAELKSVSECKTKYTRYEDLPPPHPDDIRAFRDKLGRILARHVKPEAELDVAHGSVNNNPVNNTVRAIKNLNENSVYSTP